MFYTPQQDLLKCSHCFLRLEKQISQQLLNLNQTKQTLKPHLTSHGSHGKEHVGSPKEKVTKKKSSQLFEPKNLKQIFGTSRREVTEAALLCQKNMWQSCFPFFSFCIFSNW